MCFGTDAFDTDTFSVLFYIRRKVILSPLSGDMIILCVG